MKNVTIILFCLALFLPVIVFPSSANGAAAQEAGAAFNEVEGKEWFLSEVRIAGKTTHIDRRKLEADNMGGFFTISFQEARVSGMGAPNRYFAPYTLGDHKSLNIGNIASTLMMAFKEPDDLKESEYFSYLPTVTRWDIRGGKLELYCSNNNKGEVVLVFSLK